MPFANYIYEYFSGIQSGKYTVGKWVRLIYEIIIAGLERGEYFFNAKKANKAIKFIENFCHHCEGREDLLKLEVWQKACVSVIFGIVDADGLRVFREVFIVIGRKNGKTLFASAIIAYMAYLDGEYGAKIYCLAPKLDQAAIVYDNFYQMLKKEPELAELAKKRRSDIYIEDTNTVVKPLAFNAKKSDGFNPHLVVNDEVASWRGDGGLKQYEVMKSALGARRQPLILSISTAGYENDGIYDELMKRSTAFLKGNMIIDSTEGNAGIPIGNQSSQIFALLYLSSLDHMVKEKLGIKFYGRYMDDFYLIHEDKEYLRYCWKEIERHVNELGLSLNAKTNIYPLKNGIDFLGFHSYLTESGAVIRKVRRKSKNNARRRLTKMRGLLEAGKITPEKVEQSYKSWRGHASKGNCYHLIRNMDQHYNKLFGQYAAAGNRGGVAVSEEKEEGKECRKS